MKLFSFYVFLFAVGPGFAAAQQLPWPLHGFDSEGHRGCRGLMPENSIPAFRHAINFGVTTLELDLAVSRDSQLVVSHEPWMSETICRDSAGKPTTGQAVPIWKMDYATIRRYDCGSAGNPRFPDQTRMPTCKPLLTEVFDSVAQWTDMRMMPVILFNIEIKSRPEWDGVFTPAVETFARLVVEAIDRQGFDNRVLIQSFDPRALEAVHRLRPGWNLVLLSEHGGNLQKQLSVLSFRPAAFSPYYRLLSRRMLHEAQAMGIRVVPWTVNNPKTMRRLIAWGVDGIITDFPDRLRLVLLE